MSIGKILKIATVVIASIGLFGCLGDAANTIAGTNGANLTFDPPSVNMSSSNLAQVVTVKNSNPIDGSATNITFENLSAPLSVTNNCPSTLAQNATCTITINYTGTDSGSQTLTGSYNSGSASVPITLSINYYGN